MRDSACVVVLRKLCCCAHRDTTGRDRRRTRTEPVVGCELRPEAPSYCGSHRLPPASRATQTGRRRGTCPSASAHLGPSGEGRPAATPPPPRPLPPASELPSPEVGPTLQRRPVRSRMRIPFNPCRRPLQIQFLYLSIHPFQS